MLWRFRTLCVPVRLSPVAMPCLLSVPFSKSGRFPRPALPGVSGRTGLSATLPARPAPRGVPVGACTAPTGLSVLLRLPSFHACRHHYPAGAGRCLCRFSSRPVIGLPLFSGGSAPALPFSRPARCLRMFRPAWSLNCSSQPSVTRVLQSMSLPPMSRPGCYHPKATIVA